MAWFKRRDRLSFDLISDKPPRPVVESARDVPRAEVRGRQWTAPRGGPHDQPFHVSGEQYRQEELAGVGPGARLFRLVRDPSNAHDPNAVKMMCDGVHIGFVSSRTASRYGGVVEDVEAAGYELWVHGLVKRQANAHASSWVARIDCGWPEDIPTP